MNGVVRGMQNQVRSSYLSIWNEDALSSCSVILIRHYEVVIYVYGNRLVCWYIANLGWWVEGSVHSVCVRNLVRLEKQVKIAPESCSGHPHNIALGDN